MSKDPGIDSVRVTDPCSQDWDEMEGNDQVRFCTHCSKHVNNISAMTRKRAQHLVRRSNGRLCIRYIADPRTAAPLFAEQLVPITRRTPSIAAGVMTASLSLASLAFAQSAPPVNGPVSAISEQAVPGSGKKLNDTAGGGSGRISGTVTDPQGAVVPNAEVVLTDTEGNELRRASTGDDGVYRFENVPAGDFSVGIFSPGFIYHRELVSMAEGSLKTSNVTLDIGQIMGGAMVVPRREYGQPLARAVEQGDIELARVLISQGEDVNGREDDKTTPLFVAVENGSIEMVRLLLDFGAKVNARNGQKETPLMKLDDDASKELVELLVQNGAKVNQTAEDGSTPLINAALSAKPEVVQALIDAGAEINARNGQGQTALMNAAYYDDIEKVRILLIAGAEINARNSDDETAYDQTSESEIQDLLVSFGAVVTENPDAAADEEPALPDDGPKS
jgi:hypothetical protein